MSKIIGRVWVLSWILGEACIPATSPDGIEQPQQAIWNGNGIPAHPAATRIVHTILAGGKG